ncbi:hypothetical protein GS8_1750 [Geobacillus stearothermophilus]|uniref:Uncharacterized protein n=1 Tax=Geobacillus stearothermophilus TaxID=1422 RepID=A0ABQ7HFT3_GEOSE|nr:hypothetical protein GS8_1750 [Geobacillus stearothermophilus]
MYYNTDKNVNRCFKTTSTKMKKRQPSCMMKTKWVEGEERE